MSDQCGTENSRSKEWKRKSKYSCGKKFVPLDQTDLNQKAIPHFFSNISNEKTKISIQHIRLMEMDLNPDLGKVLSYLKIQKMYLLKITNQKQSNSLWNFFVLRQWKTYHLDLREPGLCFELFLQRFKLRRSR